MVEAVTQTDLETNQAGHEDLSSDDSAQLSAEQEMLMAAYGLSSDPVTLSATMAPISPYGVGEMIRASKIEVSALDEYLYQAEIHGPLKCNLKKPSGAKVLAAKRYQSHSSDPANEKIKTSSPKLEQATQTLQNIININQSIQEVLSIPDGQLPEYQTVNERAKKREAPEIACNQMLNRRKDLRPFAEKYIKQLGYEPDSQDAQQILKETVEFYSTSPALAQTLRNLVQSLETPG